MVIGVKNTVSTPKTIPRKPIIGIEDQAPAATADTTAHVWMAILAFNTLAVMLLSIRKFIIKMNGLELFIAAYMLHRRIVSEMYRHKDVVV